MKKIRLGSLKAWMPAHKNCTCQCQQLKSDTSLNLQKLCINTSILPTINPNTIKSYKILQKLSPKHAAHGVVQSTYPIFRHGKDCLSKQPPWRAAGDPRLARGRSRFEPQAWRARCVRFFSPPSLPSFFLREIVFFRTFPTNPTKVLGLLHYFFCQFLDDKSEETICTICNINLIDLPAWNFGKIN